MEEQEMKNGLAAMSALLVLFCLGFPEGWAQDPTPAQKRIMIERGDKITGKRLALVKKVVESYKDCEVLSEGNELTGLRINGKLYSDFTLVVRDKKKTIIVATPDGVVSFDY
jgi:hypothetical protein